MTDREERQHVIEVLRSWDGYFIGYTSDEVQEALRYAIASIETDLKYDLLHEETSGQADKPTTKNDVPDNNVGKIDLITGNDCETCIHNKGVLECDMYGCKYEPTAKNDLAVDAVSRQAINGYIDYILSHGMGKKKSFDFIKKFVANLPSVTPQEPKTGYCKDCKYFEYDTVAKVDGMRLILAHEICSRWGDGCKTKEDGYCFLFEPKESEK